MDLIKKLTGKNQSDYVQAAAQIIDNADVKTFEELVKKDDFLFDFIKQNVSKRLEKACNEKNFKNLLGFTKFYSPSYEEFIASTLAKYSDDEVKNVMKQKLFNGSDEEKTYAAKYFSYIKNDAVLEKLKANSYSEYAPLAQNCAATLAVMGDKTSLDEAKQKLKSADDFEVLSAVKFISAYQDQDSLKDIFETMEKSSVSEYIACEIGYMTSFLELLKTDFYEYALIAINHILDGLGEIVALSDIFSFQLYEIFEELIFSEPNSKNAVVLLNAKNKFNTLTENDEYLFDEDKNTKDEVMAVKKLLNDNLDDDLDNFILPELNENSKFVFTALEFVKNPDTIRQLINSKNQTIILKTLEVLKSLNNLTEQDRQKALEKVSNEEIKAIIAAL